MKTKSFEKYLETRFTKEEIEEIKQQADLELKFLQSLQKLVCDSKSKSEKQIK